MASICLFIGQCFLKLQPAGVQTYKDVIDNNRIFEEIVHLLTKGDNNGAGNTIGHHHSKYAASPGILQSKLELIGLILGENTVVQLTFNFIMNEDK